jgi:cyclophilin family peptidyl-prolyl cis-trans isomerase
MDVVDTIAALETRPQGTHQDVPIDPVIINAITVQAP